LIRLRGAKIFRKLLFQNECEVAILKKLLMHRRDVYALARQPAFDVMDEATSGITPGFIQHKRG